MYHLDTGGFVRYATNRREERIEGEGERRK
jgi:hypothetical protein